MSWSGAGLYKSADGANYDSVLSVTSGAVMGRANDVLGDFDGGNVFDHVNSVTVHLTTPGELVSYTELQVLNGAGTFLLGVHGRWEVCQYQTATLVAVDTYELSGLLRGRRGTEWAQGLHAVQDIFVLANVSTWRRLNPGSGEIGLARHFKGVTFKQKLSDVTAQLFTNTAVGLKPYAPVHLAGERDGSNNLTINWIRRTRIGGEWRDYVDAAQGEPVLQFDVEVWDSDYATLLRTISGVTDVTADYSAAEQTTDGLTPGDPVYLRVYQISQAVGRGYACEGFV